MNLKKCPCCNSKAEFLNPAFSLMVKVRCTKCGMSTVKYDNKAAARKTWNRRRENTTLLEDIKLAIKIGLTVINEENMQYHDEMESLERLQGLKEKYGD